MCLVVVYLPQFWEISNKSLCIRQLGIKYVGDLYEIRFRKSYRIDLIILIPYT
jgi:hypothetical protein